MNNHHRRFHLSSALLLTAALPLACFSTPEIQEYHYSLHGPKRPVERGNGPRILVADFSASAGYDTAKLAYRVSELQLRYYTYRQWVGDPTRLLGEMMARHLKASGKFSDVGRGDKLKDPDLVLEGIIDAIEEVDLADSWLARLAMTLQVRRGDSDRILLKHAFDTTLPLPRRHPEEVARGVSKILALETDRLIRRILKVAKAKR